MLNEIKDISASIWISASAGTGKTKSLIDRILALLLNNVEPQKILCLTYTNAAAAEMLERLNAYIKLFKESTDEDLLRMLIDMGFSIQHMKVARLLWERSLSTYWVRIQTIHKFCFTILQQFPLEAGILPGAQIIDDFQKYTLLQKVFNKVLKNDCFYNDFEKVSQYAPSIIDDVFKKTHQINAFLLEHNNLNDLYCNILNISQETKLLFEKKANQKEFYQLFLEESFGTNFENEINILINELQSSNEQDAEIAVQLQTSINNYNLDFLKIFLTNEFQIRKRYRISKNVMQNKTIEEMIRCLSEKAILFKDKYNAYIFIEQNVSYFRIMEQVVVLFNGEKFKNQLLDFEDIITLSMTLFQNMNWVMYKLDNSIDHILLDEAQDTSPSQWEIIKLLTSEFFSNYESKKTIFIVGDEKQSIYSFQGADINLFQEMHSFFKNSSQGCGQKFYNIILNKSYRSTMNILSFVDEIFKNTFKNIEHFSARTEQNHEEKNNSVVEIGELADDADSKQDIAEFIADFINTKITQQTYIPSKNRPAIASDFLILFQKRNTKLINSICERLSEFQIESSGVDKFKLKYEPIVEDFINIAKFALCPMDDLTCACVLTSPFVGVNEQDLMELCINRNTNTLYDHMLQNIGKYSMYNFEILSLAVALVHQVSCYDFFSQILNVNIQRAFAARLGKSSINILDEFLNIVLNFEENESPLIDDFIKWFENFEHTIKRENVAAENQVQLMTAHASKGLQAPFVILADTTFFNNNQDNILEQENILFWNFNKDFMPKNMQSIMQKLKVQKVEELKRLLYVATTRAEDFLIILSKAKKVSNALCWRNFIQENYNKERFIENVHESGLVTQIFGQYQYAVETKNTLLQDDIRIISKQELPKWLFENSHIKTKIYTELSASNFANENTLFGDAVHLLLAELPKYIHLSILQENENYRLCYKESIDIENKLQTIALFLLDNLKLSVEIKQQVFDEAMKVILEPKFNFLFDANSLSEISFMHNSKEYRIDKIAFKNDAIFIVDFKTGEVKIPIPESYIKQLKTYEQIVNLYMNKEQKIIKTAILWTKSNTLAMCDIQGDIIG